MNKTIALILSAALFAAATACGNNNSSKSSGKSGNYIYGQIDSISGNDMVLLLADYDENASDSGASDSSDSEGKKGGRGDFTPPENGEMPEGFDPSKFADGEKPEGFIRPENGEMPEGFDPSKFADGEKPEGFTRPENGEIPEGFDPSKFADGEKPEGFTRPENGEMPEGFDKSQFSGKRPSGSKNSKYNLTGEQEEFLIPVGTVVTTDSGAETDFTVLAKGDIIKCDISKDSDGSNVINAIWVME